MGGGHVIDLEPGDLFAGKYEIVKCLQTGSMGQVYSCKHPEFLGYTVALKVLFPDIAQNDVAAARFHNEIFASYGVSHPNVVRTYDFLRDGDLLGYTMEYVEGGDLADRMGAGRPLPLAEVVSVLSQLCSGVQAIHEAGIVHRDLKPENVLISQEEVVKIADFGIARTSFGPRLTAHGGVLGTIDYVSPEYMLSSHVDWRSDIYALGVLGYEMLTGQAPFRGDSIMNSMQKRLSSEAPAPSTLVGCPPELDAIILKAMERAPESRYQSASEMFYELQELEPLIDGYTAPTEAEHLPARPRLRLVSTPPAVMDTAVRENSRTKIPVGRVRTATAGRFPVYHSNTNLAVDLNGEDHPSARHDEQTVLAAPEQLIEPGQRAEAEQLIEAEQRIEAEQLVGAEQRIEAEQLVGAERVPGAQEEAEPAAEFDPTPEPDDPTLQPLQEDSLNNDSLSDRSWRSAEEEESVEIADLYGRNETPVAQREAEAKTPAPRRKRAAAPPRPRRSIWSDLLALTCAVSFGLALGALIFG